MAQVLIMGGGGTDTSAVTATASDVLLGKVFVNADGDEVTGEIASKAAATYNVSKTDQEIAAGQYLSGKQTIRAVTYSGVDAAKMLDTMTLQIGDAGSATRILSQKGSIASKSAATYNLSTSDQTITAGQYLSGAQTIRKFVSSNITAANVKKGVVATAGDSGSSTRLINVTGTYTTISSGQTALTAAVLRSGYSGFANGGAEVKGSLATYSGSTSISPTQSAQTFSTSGKYLSSNLTVNAITYPTTFAAANIKKGVTIAIGGKSITGTFEGFVPGTKDIYYNGSWGSGYSSSNLVMTRSFGVNSTSSDYDSTVRADTNAAIRFNTGNIETCGWAGTAKAYNAYRYKFLTLTSAVAFSGYSSFGIVIYHPKAMSSSTDNRYSVIALASQAVGTYPYIFYQGGYSSTNTIYKKTDAEEWPSGYGAGTDAWKMPYCFCYGASLPSALSATSKVTIPVGYHFLHDKGSSATAITAGQTDTITFNISTVSASRYLFFTTSMADIHNSVFDYSSYGRITRIYFT